MFTANMQERTCGLPLLMSSEKQLYGRMSNRETRLGDCVVLVLVLILVLEHVGGCVM